MISRLSLILLLALPMRILATEPVHLALIAGKNQGVPGNLSAYARSLLERELGRSDRFALVERERIDAVVDEIAFQQSGVTREKGATELGELLNIDKLAYVNIHRLHPDYELTVEIVDVATGQVLRVEKQEIGRQNEQIERGVKRLAQRLIASASMLGPDEMVLIPGGTFQMGSDSGLPDERPIHAVSLKSFYLDRYEVRRIAFQEFLVAQGRQQSAALDDADHPATGVSWNDAVAYCSSLGKRLPTEAEWEFAARGTAGRTYPWGEAPPTPALARFQTRGTQPVDSLPAGATPEGVFHLAGNAAEWVHDWWHPGYYAVSPPSDPAGPPAGDYRALRGGSWNQTADELRASARAYHNSDRGAGYVGFRCARDTAR